jgi:hypothetical protein
LPFGRIASSASWPTSNQLIVCDAMISR